MFWIRLCKRVHRPLIVLAAVTFIMVTASNELEFGDNDEHRNSDPIDTSSSNKFSDNDLLLRSTLVDGANSNNDDLLGKMSNIPVSPIQQLPYCKGLNQLKSSGGDESGSNLHDNSSDELVIPPSGELKQFRSGRQIVVATLDGQLSLLDHTGKMLWTIGTGQIFSSTISSLQLNENGKWINLIPSLTGGLYKYDGERLVPMPLNADILLRRSFKLSNDVVMTGGKEVRTFGVDLTSGMLRYECGLEGCATTTKVSESQDDSVVLVVKKQLQTVRAIDSANGSERWNFSVATHELALGGVTEGCYEGEQKLEEDEPHFVKVIIPEGLIIGADQKTHIAWKHKFGSPISQAWILENGHLTVIDPIKHSPVLDESPALYIGIHKQQFYVQESHSTADKLENAFALQYSRRDDITRPIEIGWRPTSAIEGMDDNTALARIKPKYPGFYIFEKDEVKRKNHLPAIEAPPTRTRTRSDTSDDEDDDEYRRYEDGFAYFTAGAAQVIIGSLWYWWKEVLGISLLTAVILNVLLMRPLLRAVRTQTVREMLAFFRNLKNKQQEEGLALVLPSKESDTLELPSAHRARTRTTSSSSNNSHVGIGEYPTVPFSSQYLREFDPIQCLGRGGFGVVFEAKKKIDDRHYAVKRIPLPNREKNREKVMREVRALAKLDHRNIVRYFNAWFENPPNKKWLEDHDPLWSASTAETSTANYFSSFSAEGRNLFQSDSSVSNCKVHRKEYSEISISDSNKTPTDETNGDAEDSFIVFASGGEEISVSKEIVVKPSPTLSPKSKCRVSVGWDDWSECSNNLMHSKSSSSPLLPVTVNDSMRAQKRKRGMSLFVRPTSLDIPSSVDNDSSCQLSELKDSEDCDTNDEVEEVGEEATEDLCSPTDFIYLYIQQELCQKRTLQGWLRATKTRRLPQVVQFFAQIVDAVEYIHLNKLIHRDLKPGNIFLASGVESVNSDNDDVNTVLKVGDFGLATTAVNRMEKDGVTPTSENPPAQVANLTGHVGTHLYMSPEQIQNKPYDFKVDIYSLGLIFFELLVPFSTEMERQVILTRVRKMDFPTSFITEHPKEHLLISQMVDHDPRKRPNAMDIKAWVKSADNSN